MRLVLLNIAAATIAASISACAQSRNDNWARCRDSRDNPDLRVSACTTIIQSGRENPTNLASALTDRAAGYIDEHQYDLAIADSGEALKLDPTGVAFFVRGNAYARKGEYDAAIGDYGHAINLDPKNPWALNNRGNAYLREKQYDRAIRDFDQAITLDPKLPKPFDSRGCAYCAKGEYDRALQDYDQAISLDPTQANFFIDRSCAYLGKGQYDIAIQDLDKAISLDPNNPHAFLSRGEVYYLGGRDDRAIEEFNQAISLDPNNPRAFVVRGYTYYRKGQDDRAIKDFNQAISLSPKLASAFNSRGYAEFAAAQFAPAAQDFERSLTINGAQPYVVLWLHLAKARAKQEDGEELRNNAAKVDLKAWPEPIVAFFLKHQTAPQVKNSAAIGDAKTQQNQTCEASYYLGEDALLRNSPVEAAQLFRQARATCPANFVEYPVAVAELKRTGD